MILWLLLMGAAAWGGEKPNCNYFALTNGCQFFEDRKHLPEIKLPDGTGFPNPRYVPPAPPVNGKVSGMDFNPETDMRAHAMLKSQSDILNIWSSLPRQIQVSDIFKIGFNIASGSMEMRAWAEGKIAELNTPFQLPWPPTARNPQTTMVNGKDLLAFLNQLPAKQREQLKAAIRNAPVFSNGGYGHGGFNTGGQVAQPKSNSKVEERFEKLFDYAQKAILEEITKGRHLEQLSVAERAQYEKARTVKLSPLAVSATEPGCQTGFGAFYQAGQNKAHICPIMTNQPDAAVIETLGHEIAHSFDPCCNHFPLLKLNEKKVRALRQAGNWPDSIRNDPDFAKIKMPFSFFPGGYHNFEPVLQMKSREIFKRLQEEGIAEVVAPAIETEDDPNLGVRRCLEEKVGFRVLDDKALEVAAGEFARYFRSQLTVNVDTSEVEATTLKNLKKYRECVRPPGGQSQLREAMATAWGSKVMGRWLTDNPPRSEAERIAAVSWHGAQFCSRSFQQPLPDSASVDAIDATLNKSAREMHPNAIANTNRIVLTEARVAKALNCNRDERYNCLDNLGTSGPLPKKAPKTSFTPEVINEN